MDIPSRVSLRPYPQSLNKSGKTATQQNDTQQDHKIATLRINILNAEYCNEEYRYAESYLGYVSHFYSNAKCRYAHSRGAEPEHH